MKTNPKAWLVSELTTPNAFKQNEDYKSYSYSKPEFNDLLAAVGKALRDVEFHRKSVNIAVVYRKGDIHALGEVGYRSTKSKGSDDPNYYVQSRRISNQKYRDGSWQHHIVATKSLANAVKAASTYLVPFTCEESVDATKDTARQIIAESVSKFSAQARLAYKELTGEPGWGSNMAGDFITELRGYQFISPRLNQAATEFYAAFDAWKDAEAATKGGTYYVGITENYGQQVVDTAKVALGYPYTQECYEHMNAEAVADWVKGRIAVLSMVPPLHYVQGVGVRLDDRLFYVLGQKDE